MYLGEGRVLEFFNYILYIISSMKYHKLDRYVRKIYKMIVSEQKKYRIHASQVAMLFPEVSPQQ